MSMKENDKTLKSFIKVDADSDFSIQNLPYGIFKTAGQPGHVGVAIGECVLDLKILAEQGLFRGPLLSRCASTVFSSETLNDFIALGRPAWREARARISELLRADHSELRDDADLRNKAFHHQSKVTLQLPILVKGYTDFYSSKEHATNLGMMFRSKEDPLLPNWSHLPVGYDGRASSIVVSETDVHRPCGQIKPNEAAPPVFSPSQRLCTELELAFIVGQPSPFGASIAIDEAASHVFGAVLLSDWSARDIQKWEYVPLGPFLGKNFCTTISPWVVPLDALLPFRVPGPKQDPRPLDYLLAKNDEQADWNLDIHLEMHLKTEAMTDYECISKTNFKGIYWNLCQQLAHHSVNGCPMQTGDLYASGTVSGDAPGTYGSILELSWAGKTPIELSNGERRIFLEDGDSVALRGFAQGQDYRVGFGQAAGRVSPAKGTMTS